MQNYYIYHVPGIKIGATKDWETRRVYNFETYNIEPIIVETMEGPDNEDMWQIVGDREWELADEYGYDRGTHYKVARENRPKWNNETRHRFTNEDLEKAKEAHRNSPNRFKSKHTKKLMSISKCKLMDEADIIRERFEKRAGAKGKFYKNISKEYNVSVSTIRRIIAKTVY